MTALPCSICNGEAAQDAVKGVLVCASCNIGIYSSDITIWNHQQSNRRVVCAAVRFPRTGRIICGPRHWDSIMWAQFDRKEEVFEERPEEQGFVDQYCNFLTREQAYVVAKARGQILDGKDDSSGTLFSEMLY